jgi:N-formylglutamate deformylase
MQFVPGVLTAASSTQQSVPVVFDVPRSGTWYPCDFRPAASFRDVHQSVSMYVGDLYRDVVTQGATLLCALFPNSYIDANRHETDIDPDLLADDWTGPVPLAPTIKSKLGIGLIHSMVTGRRPLYDHKLTAAEVQQRINRYYLPYHGALAGLIERNHTIFGVSYHVSCHSMASIGGTSALDAAKSRSAFDVGDLKGASCDRDFSDVVQQTLRSHGFNVTSNVHYAGAEAVHRHSRVSERRHSLQIEMNRALYMDEKAFTPLPGFAQMQAVLTELAKVVGAYAMQNSRTGS